MHFLPPELYAQFKYNCTAALIFSAKCVNEMSQIFQIKVFRHQYFIRNSILCT